MMHLILADSELELMPEEIKKRKILLDSSLHHSLMKGLKDWKRRGRPDIVHVFLLIAQESILNRKGLLKTYIHTRNDEIIYVNPEMRIIKNYNRFKGLMQQLLIHGKVPLKGKSLMEMKKERLDELLNKIRAKKIVFSRKGKRKALQDVFEENVVCIIGGFPSGNFISPVEKYTDEVISLHEEMLPAWIVAMEAIVAYENFMKSSIH